MTTSLKSVRSAKKVSQFHNWRRIRIGSTQVVPSVVNLCTGSRTSHWTIGIIIYKIWWQHLKKTWRHFMDDPKIQSPSRVVAFIKQKCLKRKTFQSSSVASLFCHSTKFLKFSKNFFRSIQFLSQMCFLIQYVTWLPVKVDFLYSFAINSIEM